MNPWIIKFYNSSTHKIGVRETLCTLGNGYLAIRGATEEAKIDGLPNYPGTYMAGVYNPLESFIDKHKIQHEDLVNCPNSLMINCHPTGLKNGFLKSKNTTHFQLDLYTGCVERKTLFCDSKGLKTLIKSKRIVSMNNPHLAAVKFTLKPLNWSGEFTLISGIDGNIKNTGVPRYQELNNQHLVLIERKFFPDNLLYLSSKTSHSDIQIYIAIKHSIFLNKKPISPPIQKSRPNKSIAYRYQVSVKKGQTLSLEKIISAYNSKDFAVKCPRNSAIDSAINSESFTKLYIKHKKSWADLWNQSELISNNSDHNELRILRLHFFHLLQTVSPHSIGLDYGTPARGLHGEAYRGHVFWDEIFILPYLTLKFPEITRSLLLYRYRRLNKARELAHNSGFKGAMYPWQSASNGNEVSQAWHLNPNTKAWDQDHSYLQRHVNCAIAYNIWHYYQTTSDRAFLVSYGAIMLIEITRFLVSLCLFNKNMGLYEIKNVMGPDEYHEKYPSGNKMGVHNNAYTNIMTAWVITKTLEMVGLLSNSELASFNLSKTEISKWKVIIRKIFIPFHDGVISQFQDYELLKELDWEKYRRKYGNIERLDRILKSENDSTDNYKVSKQADVVMLFYLVPKLELKKLFKHLGINLTDQLIRNTIYYYLERCSHGSTLSKMVYSAALRGFDPKKADSLHSEALLADYADTQQGTTREGIHLGLMAGTLLIHHKNFRRPLA